MVQLRFGLLGIVGPTTRCDRSLCSGYHRFGVPMPASPAFESYSEAVDYLYSYVNWEVARHMRYSPDVMTLDRPRAVLSALGDPHTRYPIIHIAGTKGKGSVGAMCAAVLRASGLKVGLYSSPHLQDFRERFRVDNRLITEHEFVSVMERLRPVVESVPDITWFEVTTALAFLFFAEQKVDIAVIEVGLGGRLDATNVVTPIVSVITSLSYDHTHLLGDSLSSIAREKAGIIKPGVPVVSAPQVSEALDVIMQHADAKGAPLILVGRDWVYRPEQSTVAGEWFYAGRPGDSLRAYFTRLSGEHQALNATVALAALHVAGEHGVKVTAEGIRQGFEQVDWPGRLEVAAHDPLVVLDAAHNGASARQLRFALDTLFSQRPRALVFGASADKDVDGMFQALLSGVDHVIAAQAVHPRALAPKEIAAIARLQNFEGTVLEIPDVNQALSTAREMVGPDGLVCVAGSLFIVGEVRTVCGLPAGHVAKTFQGLDSTAREPSVS